MPARLRVSNEALIESYGRLGNVHKVGAEFGIRGSSVHERLQNIGAQKPMNFITEQDRDLIRAEYSAADGEVDLTRLAKSLGRSRQTLCKEAASMGLTNRNRPKPSSASTRGIPRWGAPGLPAHPRGALGLKHSDETKRAIGVNSRKTWAHFIATGTGQMSEEARQRRSDRSTARADIANRGSNRYSRTRKGYREDLGDHFFRSSWEANYARYLNLLIRMGVVVSWEFEPETFWFEKIKRGVRSYMVDFKVQYANESKPTYVEVKGWMDPKSKTKIARFRKYYPQHRLEIVGEKEYRNIKACWASSIPLWETAK